MSNLRLVAIEEYQYLTCIKHSLWGSKSARFKHWQKGDFLAFIVDKAIAGLANVKGKPFQSRLRVWNKDIYPHRIPIKFVHALNPENRIPILGEVRDALTSSWGPKYGWGILNQQVLTNIAAETILKVIQSRPNNLSEIESNLKQLLVEVKQRKEIQRRTKRKKGIRKQKITEVEEVFKTKEEESIHTKTQASLIDLGKITGCSVWIASNDRGRKFKGRPLGHRCLKSFPNLGLSKEATRRISLIDIIWIRQNAPICVFEIETTSSIYSGLLRMADLLSVVPALNIKLYIIAPIKRQNKVMAELSRPIFRKIGLNDFCKFIPIEELDSLLEKVEGFEGHVQSSIIDTISIQIEEELGETI